MNLILRKQHYFLSFLVLVAFLGSLLGPAMPALAVDIPVLVAPADNVTVVAVPGSGDIVAPPVALPEFSWEPVAGAATYRIEFARDIGFTQSLTFANTPFTHYLPTSVTSFIDGEWYWRVQVATPTPAGGFSEPRRFIKMWASPENKPILVSPNDGDALEFFDAPVFSWQPVVGARSYRLQIDITSEFTAPTSYVTLATTFQPIAKLANGTYYWRVVPLDPADKAGTPSDFRTFEMAYGVGASSQVPVLLTPANGSTPTFTPTFSWTAVRGAQSYLLEYSTNSDLSSPVSVPTYNTTYTPLTPLLNDVNYYWHVRAKSSLSESDWSPVWTFQKQWYTKPVLLTPTDNYQNIRIPTFSWTPVPGASYYKIELDDNTGFSAPLLLTEDGISNTFYTPKEFKSIWTDVYWRVTPYDAAGKAGKVSNTSFFKAGVDKLAPELISPYFYYEPNSFPPPFNTISMAPYSDRTVALPVFYWHRLTAFPGGVAPAKVYRLQVSENPSFVPLVWEVITQNTHAAPTKANNFIADPAKVYFWRVRGEDGFGIPVGEWSQTWITHIVLQPGSGLTTAPPQLRRPLTGDEFVEATPLLEWYPVVGADEYQVQISLDPTFATLTNSGVVKYPVYSPLISLAQRSLGVLDYGTYYWRVKAFSGGVELGDWSETRRFQVASQSGRIASRTLGSPVHRLQIASDATGDEEPSFDLTSLYAMQDSNAWYFGFNATVTITDTTYALYIDLDHMDNSGGDSDPRGAGYNVTTISAHRPEYAIYVLQTNAVITDTQTLLYAWNGTSWGFPQILAGIGGDLFYDEGSGYVELRIPNTAIGMSDTTGSYAVSLFSAASSAPGTPVDRVPSDVSVPGGGPIESFASVSERMNAIMPVTTPVGDPTIYPFVFPFEWDNPAVNFDPASLIGNTAPWSGGFAKAYTDPGYTAEVGSFEMKSNTPYYSFISHHWPDDFLGDNTYYWRVRPCYFGGTAVCGVWTQGARFVRVGFVPTNLSESVTFSTPTFSWSMVEGAKNYTLQIDEANNFSSPTTVTTSQNSYTPLTTLAQGTYYWRLRVVRYGGETSNWTAARSFTLTLPKPTGLTVNGQSGSPVISTVPTFCWEPLLASSNAVPVLAAYRYRLEASNNPNFTNPTLYTYTNIEQSCYTPMAGSRYADGLWYWRVAMYDGQSRLGGYSDVAAFTKQYPTAKPLSPVSGSTASETPVFIWTGMDGVTPYVFGAAKYRIEIHKNDTFTNQYDFVETVNTQFVPIKIYTPNTTYYWRVRIIDADDQYGPWSNAILIIDPRPNKAYLPLVRK